MSLQMCSKFQLKEVKVGDDEKGASAAAAAGSIFNFLENNVASDDIFYEIFVRLPDCRSAIVCSTVSRRWNALISHPRFVRSFISHHKQHRVPCTVFFRKCEKTLPFWFSSALDYQPICTLFSEESTTSLHGKSKCYLDFLPSPMIVRASCDDLLLLTPGSKNSTVFYVCNPVTKQLYRLPDLPQPIEMCGYALARTPESECHFKVVLFHMPCFPNEGQSSSKSLKIYCSELGKWEKIRFMCPRSRAYFWDNLVEFCMCNGNLYWLELEKSSERVLSFGLWGNRRGCSVIDFPDDFWWFRTPKIVWCVREQIGTVGGELRLVQVVLTQNKFVDLKVWRLLDTCSSSPTWVLVHDKKYSTRPNEEEFVATFVHPTNGDLVFMVWGKSVFQCNLTMEEDAYEMVAELQEPLKLNTGRLFTTDRLMSLTMLHLPWPTPLPLQK